MINSTTKIRLNVDYLMRLYDKGVEDCLISELPYPDKVKAAVKHVPVVAVTDRQVLIARNDNHG